MPVKLGKHSIAAIEVLQGLVPGDQVIISDTRDYAGAPELLITR
jgi:hypothetical protein